MKKVLIAIGIVLVGIGVYAFFHKTYLKFELAGEIRNASKDLYPDAYGFFHTDSEFQSYLDVIRNNKSGRYDASILNIKFDFEKYSYVVVYGRKVKAMHHSYKESVFNDISPGYARPSGRVVVFMEYENGSAGEGIYFYRIPKDARLRGFFGV